MTEVVPSSPLELTCVVGGGYKVQSGWSAGVQTLWQESPAALAF